MRPYCAVLGVDNSSVPWSALEGTGSLRFFFWRVFMQVGKAYSDGYRLFGVCLENVMDYYLAMEVIGLKDEKTDVGLITAFSGNLCLNELTDEQLWMHGVIMRNSNMPMNLGTELTPKDYKDTMVTEAGRIIVATASFFDPDLQGRVQVYAQTPGSREFIEIPLDPRLQVHNGKRIKSKTDSK